MKTETLLFSAAQVRELDRRAIESRGISGATLMERAGLAAFRVLRARFPRARRIAVACGCGNNGGDGYVLARLAKEAGFEPTVFAFGDASRASFDATSARVRAQQAGVAAQPFTQQRLRDAEVIVDALLGTGLERPVQSEWRATIEAINASDRPALAIDIPSGLHGDTGVVMGAAVKARVTVSFIGLKAGLFTGAGREYAGEILFDDLDVPPQLYEGARPLARRLTEEDLIGVNRRRSRDSHKGSYGHVLVVGGGPGMPGAARLCGEAAYRAGAGLVSLAAHSAHAGAINAARPELLAHAVRQAKELNPLMASASVLALGPGLSQGVWAKSLFKHSLAAKLPMVVDADALNLLAAKPTKRGDWILTPHPGEAARLLNTKTTEVQKNRFEAVRAIVKRYGGVCVLKGSGALIASAEDETIWLCDRGNPGMASGGTGDVLTGVIAALRAQGLTAIDSARLGVWLHATAGDRVAQQQGEIGLLASDLSSVIRAELNRLLI